jgi:hypothetical protein
MAAADRRACCRANNGYRSARPDPGWGAASLINLIIHAVLLGALVWTVTHLAVRDSAVPAFL